MTNTLSGVAKTALTILLCGALSYLKPIYSAFLVITIFFVLDLIFGLISGVILAGEGWRMRKFGVAIGILACYFVVLSTVYTTGERMGDEQEGLYVHRIVTYIFIYGYATNLLKNLIRLFPDSAPFRMLYHLLTFEFFKKFPQLKNKQEKKEKENG